MTVSLGSKIELGMLCCTHGAVKMKGWLIQLKASVYPDLLHWRGSHYLTFLWNVLLFVSSIFPPDPLPILYTCIIPIRVVASSDSICQTISYFWTDYYSDGFGFYVTLKKSRIYFPAFEIWRTAAIDLSEAFLFWNCEVVISSRS